MIPLDTQPLWLSGTLLIGLATLLAMVAPIFVRQRAPSERLRINNEVAGFTFATVGVLYAVLLAFAVIIVWEKFSEAEHAVAQEAGAAATLYRLANGIGEGVRRSSPRQLDPLRPGGCHGGLACNGAEWVKPRGNPCPRQHLCGPADVHSGRRPWSSPFGRGSSSA